MHKKKLLENWFTDVKINGYLWEFSKDGETLKIDDYTFSNIVASISLQAEMKNEILNRATKADQYFLKHSDFKPTLRIFKIGETILVTGKKVKTVSYFSWDFENYQGVTDKETREFLEDPEKLQTYAQPITKQEAEQTIKDVLFSEEVTDGAENN